MPVNPLIGSQQKTMSTDTQDHEELTPVPEGRVGSNHPYRGIEQHGVPDTEHPDPNEDWSEATGDGEYVDEKPEIEPVPVIIVNSHQREFKDWLPHRTTCGLNSNQLVGQNLRRSNLVITNLDATHTIYLGPDSSVATFTGFPLKAGFSMTFLTSQADVWAISDDGSLVQIAILEEYSK